MIDSRLGLNPDGTLSEIIESEREPDSLKARLEPYPFLRACLEDYDLVRHIAQRRVGGVPRHAVVLMHDAIEFVLYEILLLSGEDIYADGQHTIGLNSALSLCKKNGIDVPLIGTVRTIQKHRGDAKHHAQVPHDNAFDKMLAEFEIVITRLVYEQFGSALDDAVTKLELMPYQVALYDCYRKYRNHNWNLAVRFILGALLHKYRRLLSTKEIYTGIPNEPIARTIVKLTNEFKAVDKRKAKELVEFILSIPDALITYSDEGDLRSCAEAAAEAYSRMDDMVPSFFESGDAVFLTPRLVLIRHIRIRGAMGWSRWTIGDTKKKDAYLTAVGTLLKKHPEFVGKFGEPNYEEEDDRYWRYWHFGVFDGMRWHTFEMHDHFSILLESMELDNSHADHRERVARMILEEFKEAVAKASGQTAVASKGL